MMTEREGYQVEMSGVTTADLDAVYTCLQIKKKVVQQKKQYGGLKMQADYHRHDISDEVWALIAPHMPGQRGQWGGIAKDNRVFINAVFWVMRTGEPWRNLPPDYGKWGTAHQRFRRWRDKGIWEKLLVTLINNEDYVWLMIDSSHDSVHPEGSGAVGGNQAMERTKGNSIPRYIWPWMRLVVRSEYLSQRVPLRIVGLANL